MSFVLTAQFVLVNVVIAVLMKHLEESNKEAKEAEAEAELELEQEMEALGRDREMHRGHMPPLGSGDMGGPGGSPWLSRDLQDLSGPLYPIDSPTADIRRDFEDHLRTDPDPPQNLVQPLEVSRNAVCEVIDVQYTCNFQNHLMSQSMCWIVKTAYDHLRSATVDATLQ